MTRTHAESQGQQLISWSNVGTNGRNDTTDCNTIAITLQYDCYSDVRSKVYMSHINTIRDAILTCAPKLT